MDASPSGNGQVYANGRAHPAEPLVATWLGIAQRRWAWCVGIFVVVLAASVALILTQRPIYRAEARLRLADPPPMSGVNASAGMLSVFGVGGSSFANDFQLLRSRSLREAVVAEGSLQVGLVARAGWHRDSLFVSLVAGRDTEKATFEATWTAGGRVEVRRIAPTDSLIGTFAPGIPAAFGDMTVVFRARKPLAPESFQLVTVPFGEAVQQLQGRLEVVRAARDANVLDLRLDDRDPGLAELVVGSAVAHFIALRAELYQRESGETVDSLRVVAEETRAELGEAETRLEALQRESGLVAADAQSEAMVERYSAALLASEAAHAELDAVTSALARLTAAENPGEAWISLVAHPQFLSNQTVGEVLMQLTQLEQRRIQLAGARTPENADYRTLVDQIAVLDSSLRSLARNYRQGLEERVRVFDAQVAALDAQLTATPSLMIELTRRQRDMRVLTEVFVLTEQRLRQEELRQALTFANVQVIDPAGLRFRPVWPRKKLMLGAGLLLAMGFGVLGMLVVERADGSVRSARHLAPYMASPLLAAVRVGRSNGVPGALELTSAEVELLLRRGRLEGQRSHLLVVSAGALGDAESLARALESGVASNGSSALVASVTVLPTVASRAAAESAARHGAPVLVVMRAGETDGRAVAGMLELLASAGATVAGGVLLCRTTREAHIAWS